MSRTTISWLIAALLGLFLVIFAWKKSKPKESNYKGIFYLGLIFTSVGLLGKIRYNELGFLPIGLLFLVVGWAKRDKWKNPKEKEVKKKS